MRTVEVYVKREKRLKPPPNGDYSIYSEHPCLAKYDTIRTLSSADEKALEVLTAIAKEKEITLKVYDVSTLKGKLRALVKGIKNTPAVIIGTSKIDGIPNKEELLRTL